MLQDAQISDSSGAATFIIYVSYSQTINKYKSDYLLTRISKRWTFILLLHPISIVTELATVRLRLQ